MSKSLIGTPDPDQPPPGPAMYNEHAEHTVLAAALHHPQLVPYLMAVLRPTHFSSPACREVFLGAAAVYRHKESCTPAAVAAELGQQASSADETKSLLHNLTRAPSRWSRWWCTTWRSFGTWLRCAATRLRSPRVCRRCRYAASSPTTTPDHPCAPVAPSQIDVALRC